MTQAIPQMPASQKTVPHESAGLHVTGEATYTDDIPEIAGTLFCALGLSQKAHAKIKSMDLDAVRAAPGVVAVLTASDIPGKNDCGPIIADDPILADSLVQCIGQPIFAVIADSYDQARRAARKAEIGYEELPAVLTPEEAKRLGSFVVPPMHLVRGDPGAKLAAAPHRLKQTRRVGGQEQFYLEGQISYAVPKEQDGMLVYCSTQHPSEMQHLVANALLLASNQVDGGGAPHGRRFRRQGIAIRPFRLRGSGGGEKTGSARLSSAWIATTTSWPRASATVSTTTTMSAMMMKAASSPPRSR